jgi:hypothetical protein
MVGHALLLLILATGAPSAMSAPPHQVRSNDPWRVISVDEKEPRLPELKPTAVIRFADGVTLQPQLYGVSVIGELPSPGHAPFIVIGGSDCTECDADTDSVFIARVTEWRRDTKASEPRGSWFSQYPHRNFQAETKTLWDWSRLFIGRCLGGGQTAIVSFGADRDPTTKTWRREVKWASVENDRLRVVDRDGPPAPSLDAVRQTVKEGRCREVHQETFDEPFF